ncbi:MAG: IS200/IS605 family transposase [Phycisphaeraceae bacterium]|nr:IS200/IS605 family transposase [Phycisphaeraceae bacterium]
MPSSWTQVYFHIVFSTKAREPMIEEAAEDRLYAFMGGIVRDLRGVLIAAGGMPDHVHLLVRSAPDCSLAEIAREVKARSSKWIAPEFAWQRGYGGFSVSKSAVDEVERYIRTQKEHHRNMSFKDEFLSMLQRHAVEFDPKYVFE